jgi:uncharacterized protein
MTGFNPKSLLSEIDVDRLQSLLMTRAVPNGGMNLEMLDGLLCGLLAGPCEVPPAEYEPLIWGGKVRWESPAEGREAEQLVQRLIRFIEARIAVEPDREEGGYMPLLSMPADMHEDPARMEAGAPADFPLGAAWAGGFLQAIDLRLPQWRRLEQHIEGLQESIALLLRLIQLEASSEDGTAPPDFHGRLNILTAMPYMLRILDHRRRSERARHAAARPH